MTDRETQRAADAKFSKIIGFESSLLVRLTNDDRIEVRGVVHAAGGGPLYAMDIVDTVNEVDGAIDRITKALREKIYPPVTLSHQPSGSVAK